MKLSYSITGIDCPNCAAKLERKIQKIDGVSLAALNFMTSKLLVEGDDDKKDAIMAGISRTAFYKYRDAVSLSETESGQPVTVHLTLFDRPGVLSGVLAAFAAVGANIRTVNQNIPQKNAAAAEAAPGKSN